MKIVTVAAALTLRGSPCSVGLHDPFSDSYCADVSKECDCLRSEARGEIDDICSSYPGDCTAALQARIAELDQCIATARQARDDAFNETLRDALGGVGGVALSEIFPYGPFSSECVGQCSDYKALCDYGMCNTQLDQLKHEVSHVKGYHELLQLKLQELQTVGGSC
jgi:hypothetical protein